MSKILIGCDPELFIYNSVSGLPVSAHDIIPGTKAEPHKVTAGAIQVDGVAAEFNIEPAASLDEFRDSIFLVKGALWRCIRKVSPKYILKAEPTCKFTKRLWDAIPQEAKELGCTPDFNAYTMTINEKPHTDKFMRTGSGHIHISWGEEIKDPDSDEHFENCAKLTKHLDAHLYPNSLVWDPDEERRELYGKVGCFRPKPYGVEYRVLSNAWLDRMSSIDFVYRTAVTCTTCFLEGQNPGDYSVMRYKETN